MSGWPLAAVLIACLVCITIVACFTTSALASKDRERRQPTSRLRPASEMGFSYQQTSQSIHRQEPDEEPTEQMPVQPEEPPHY